jgi:hypothetical protein
MPAARLRLSAARSFTNAWTMRNGIRQSRPIADQKLTNSKSEPSSLPSGSTARMRQPFS